MRKRFASSLRLPHNLKSWQGESYSSPYYLLYGVRYRCSRRPLPLGTPCSTSMSHCGCLSLAPDLHVSRVGTEHPSGRVGLELRDIRHGACSCNLPACLRLSCRPWGNTVHVFLASHPRLRSEAKRFRARSAPLRVCGFTRRHKKCGVGEHPLDRAHRCAFHVPWALNDLERLGLGEPAFLGQPVAQLFHLYCRGKIREQNSAG